MHGDLRATIFGTFRIVQTFDCNLKGLNACICISHEATLHFIVDNLINSGGYFGEEYCEKIVTQGFRELKTDTPVG
jgi:hypothetical protein